MFPLACDAAGTRAIPRGNLGPRLDPLAVFHVFGVSSDAHDGSRGYRIDLELEEGER